MTIISARDPASVLVRKAGAALVSTQRGNAFSAEVTLNLCSVAGKGGHFAKKGNSDVIPSQTILRLVVYRESYVELHV
jgi:hypothetical protein